MGVLEAAVEASVESPGMRARGVVSGGGREGSGTRFSSS
jgi:hypothetical protein